MKSGDFFLVSERGITSRIIQAATHGPWNHCGLIVDTGGGTIEAFASGVAHGELIAYENDPRIHLTVVDSGLTDAQRTTAVAFAFSCVGDKYDLLDIASFGINLLTNGGLVLGRNHRYICSSLVYRCFQQATEDQYMDDCHTISPNDLARIWRVK